MTLILNCEYCGLAGTVGALDSELEIKYHKFVCKDTASCDKRWDKANPEIKEMNA